MFEKLHVACPDIDRQHTLLNEVSRLVDEGVVGADPNLSHRAD